MENAATDKYAEYGESRLDLIQDLDLVKEKKIVDLRVRLEDGPHEPYMVTTIIYNMELKKLKNFVEHFRGLTLKLNRIINDVYDRYAVVNLRPSE